VLQNYNKGESKSSALTNLKNLRRYFGFVNFAPF